MDSIKLICFDLDETLITKSSWKELSLALGISAEKDRELYNDYKSGLFSYDEWNNKIIELYLKHENSNRQSIIEILSRYTYNPGAREIIDYLKNKGYRLVLISGSIDLLVDMVAKELGIDYSKANNTFIFDQDGKLLGVHSPGDDVQAKLRHLESFCALIDIDIKECACVADGDNDIEMFRKTGHGITFKGSDIENESWKVIDTFLDLRNIF